MMDDDYYFVVVWEPLPPEQHHGEGGIIIDHHITKIERLLGLEKAWIWILANGITKYSVYRAECIIDNSDGGQDD